MITWSGSEMQLYVAYCYVQDEKGYVALFRNEHSAVQFALHYMRQRLEDFDYKVEHAFKKDMKNTEKRHLWELWHRDRKAHYAFVDLANVYDYTQ